MDFTSNPSGLSERTIVAAIGGGDALNSLLVGGNVQTALQDEAQSIFTGYALPTVLNPIESDLAQAFGLQDFNIDYQPNAPLLLSVTKKIGPRLDIKYTHFLNNHVSSGAVGSTLTPLQYTLALDYNFSSRFHLSLSTDDQHDNAVSLGGSFNF
jgi:hypothetical protein